MASYFQSYFQSTSMPKRLLQYALSRLEILDTTKLDLKNLDIVWGRNSTFEFKDVGLRLRKLESFLRLPASLEITTARILLLRVTVPVDVYSSSIRVEVDGVECLLRVKKRAGPVEAISSPHATGRQTSPDSIESPRTDISSKNDPNVEPTLPSAVHLTESFLQAEPSKEKEELEAAILSETQDLAASTVSSDEGHSSEGTGAALSLPAFMATFLQGIVDRLEVKIHGILINADVAIPVENSRSPTSSSTDSVSIQLKVEDVDVQGVTHGPVDPPGAEPNHMHKKGKKGKRLILLKQIRGSLSSDASLLANLARSSAIPSPTATQSNIRPLSRSKSATSSVGLGGFDGSHVNQRTSEAFSRVSSSGSSLRRSEAVGKLQPPVTAIDNERFEDTPEEYDHHRLSCDISPEHISQFSDSVLEDSAYLDQITESQYSDDRDTGASFGAASLRYNNVNPKSSSSIRQASTQLPPAPRWRKGHTSQPSIDRAKENILMPRHSNNRHPSENTSHRQAAFPLNRRPQSQSMSTESSLKTLSDATHGGGDTIPSEEALVQSQLFSHKDAESMYMSALGQDPETIYVPGGWEQSSNDSDEASSHNADSPVIAKSTIKPLDNLASARKLLPHPNVAGSEQLNRPFYNASPETNLLPSESLPQVKSSQDIPSLLHKSSPSSERSTASSIHESRVVKQLINLDYAAIYLPAVTHSSPIVTDSRAYEDTISSNSLDDNSMATSSDVPGAFSTMSPSKTPLLAQRTDPISFETKPIDQSVDVAIGSLSAFIDIPVGKLVSKVGSLILDAFQENPAESTRLPQGSSGPDIKLSTEFITLKLLKKLENCYITRETQPDPWMNDTGADVLLQTSLKAFKFSMIPSQSLTKITVGNLNFGYASEHILSFDSNLQFGASVREHNAKTGFDVSMSMLRTAGLTRFEFSSLPVHVSLDLLKLDDVFSWYGGLSSVLNLGGSIASNQIMLTASPDKSRARGVRFAAPIKPGDTSIAYQNKADIRLGGLVLDLIGSECSFDVKTSAIKIVSRDEGIGIGVNRIRVTGPDVKCSNENPAIALDIDSTRVDYRSSPADADLDRLLSLITPSKSKYEQDDDILLDTLLRQRRQGPVLRLSVDQVRTRVANLEKLSYLPGLVEEASKLSSVAKYLPDDARPGLLVLIEVHNHNVHINFEKSIGTIDFAIKGIEIAQITLPALVALSVSTVSAHRNGSESLLGVATDIELREPTARSPTIMARMIGDEMEPVIKVKLWNLQIEYRVPTMLALLGLWEDGTNYDLSADLTTSVATLTGLTQTNARKVSKQFEKPGGSPSRHMKIDVVVRDCVLGLNPQSMTSKILIVLTTTHVSAVLPTDQTADVTAELNKGSLLVIDDIANISQDHTSGRTAQSYDGGSSQVTDLSATGFVPVGYISSAKAIVKITKSESGEQSIDVELRDDLFVLESCADSTQTLLAALNELVPPTPPSKETKYRTKVIPVHDLLASLSWDAFGTAEGDYDFDEDFGLDEALSEADVAEGDASDDLDLDSQFYQQGAEELCEEIDAGSRREACQVQPLTERDTSDGVLLGSFSGEPDMDPDEHIDFQENYFGIGSMLERTAHRWNSAKNTYDKSNAINISRSPLKVRIRDVHIIWNLFDGYDWQSTRDAMSKAVQDVEIKAIENRARNERRPTFEQDFDDEDTVIGDFLFNSIYIGVPGNRDPRELAAAINQELNDTATESESVATTTVTSANTRPGSSRRAKPRKLRLNRSKHHKITFELKGVCVDLVTFPPGSGETQSSIDLRVHDFEIFDHVPTSTWRKFATYMQDAGEREIGSNMIHIEILNVKPVPQLAASEMVLKATVLPLRLHVDQDALDFITRYFEFKSESAIVTASGRDVPFLQRVEVNSVQVKLDFKPKRVDYAGLRSGHTTEFMNFVILDEAFMVLRHTIIYGISGFDKLGKCLNDIWMPDIKRNQLPSILAGLAPVRSLVNVGDGFRHLVIVPMHEYKKDGRVVRGISKGAAKFARTTGTELVKLGAKVAIGVQTVLQGAEGFLASPPPSPSKPSQSEDDEEEEKNKISPYANQPVGVFQGFRGGYAGLQRDLIVARDAIIAVPGEIMEEGTAKGILKAVRRHAPTVILRPAIGVAKAGGQIFMGATNSIDPGNLTRVDAKYKKH